MFTCLVGQFCRILCARTKSNTAEVNFPIDLDVFSYLLEINFWPFCSIDLKYFGTGRKLNKYCKQYI